MLTLGSRCREPPKGNALLPLLDALEDVRLGTPPWINGDVYPLDYVGHDSLDHEVHYGREDEREESLICSAAYKVAYLGQVQDGNVANDRSLLYEGHDLVPVDWKEVPCRLRQDYLEEPKGV